MTLRNGLITAGVIFPAWKNGIIRECYKDIVRTFAIEDTEEEIQDRVDEMLENSGISKGLVELLSPEVRKRVESNVLGTTFNTSDETCVVYDKEILKCPLNAETYAHEAVHFLATPAISLVRTDVPFAYAFGYFAGLTKNPVLFEKLLASRGTSLKAVGSLKEISPGDFCNSQAQHDGLCLAKKLMK